MRTANAGGSVSGTASMENRLPASWQKPEHATAVWSYDPAVATLGIYPREMKMYVYTKKSTYDYL